MKIYGAANLLAAPPPPIRWAVEGILPMATIGDLAGPPGEGKSTLILDLATSIASGCGSWCRHACLSGKVVLLGGERGDEATLARDLHRVQRGRIIEPGNLLVPSDNNNHPPIWHWSSDGWVLTGWGMEVTSWLQKISPALVVLDTHMAVTSGTNQLDNTQQYAFGVELKRWSFDLGEPVVLTISHTNQGSAGLPLPWRLHYLSRAGGNGLPGSLRWVAGLSRLRPDDAIVKARGLEHEVQHKWLVAVAVSKANAMPPCAWSPDAPGIFELMPNGGLKLFNDEKEIVSASPRKVKKREMSDRSPGLQAQLAEVRRVPDWL